MMNNDVPSAAHPEAAAAAAPPTRAQVEAAFQLMEQQLAVQQQQIAALLRQVAAPAAGPRRPDGPRLAPPAPFDGRPAALDAWVTELVRQFDWYGTTQDDERLRIARGFLAGAAQDWWAHTDEAARPSTWIAFVAALRLRFQPVTTAENARAALMGLAQGKRGINDYIARFRVLLVHVPDMGEADRLFHFLRGLDRSVATQLRVQGVKHLEAALDMAARVGNVLGDASAFAGPVGAAAGHHAPMELDALHELAAVSTDGTSSSATPQESGTQALLHQLLNALREERRSGKGTGSSSRAPGGAPSGTRGGGSRGLPRIPHLSPIQVQEYMDQGKCFGCGSKDHAARACPKRKEDADGRPSWSN
jgi:hypothetical protein